MPTMYARVNFSAEYLEEASNKSSLVESGFLSTMPVSIISISRGDASFRLESDSVISGSSSLKFKDASDGGNVYILDCNAVYKCSIKADFLDKFLDASEPATLGGITLNDPESGDLVGLNVLNPVRGVKANTQEGPWGRMGAMVTITTFEIELETSKNKIS
jgi:hypothetical protein